MVADGLSRRLPRHPEGGSYHDHTKVLTRAQSHIRVVVHQYNASTRLQPMPSTRRKLRSPERGILFLNSTILSNPSCYKWFRSPENCVSRKENSSGSFQEQSLIQLRVQTKGHTRVCPWVIMSNPRPLTAAFRPVSSGKRGHPDRPGRSSSLPAPVEPPLPPALAPPLLPALAQAPVLARERVAPRC